MASLAIQPEMNAARTAPLALYVHWPFCVSKCPYCDFNSHVRSAIDQDEWRDALLADLAYEASLLPGRTLTSIFFGGGTPSLMEPATVSALIGAARGHWPASDDIEITLEVFHIGKCFRSTQSGPAVSNLCGRSRSSQGLAERLLRHRP